MSNSKLSYQDKQELVKEYELGASLVSLQNKFGLDYTTLVYHLKKMGVRTSTKIGRPSKYTGLEVEKQCSICKETKHVSEFGAAYNDRCKSKYASCCKQCAVAKRSMSQYSITYQQYKNIVGDGLCDICCKEQNAFHLGKRRSIFIDHDHSTGKIRGKLCEACNSAISLAKDSVDTLGLLKRYLAETPCSGLIATMGPITKAASQEIECITELSVKRRNYHRAYNYGILPSKYAELVKKQNNKCACCGLEHTANDRSPELLIDHCHSSGAIRGLVCWQCNLALGKFSDNPWLLDKAITYLDKNKS
jgi:hypothetical protein